MPQVTQEEFAAVEKFKEQLVTLQANLVEVLNIARNNITTLFNRLAQAEAKLAAQEEAQREAAKTDPAAKVGKKAKL